MAGSVPRNSYLREDHLAEPLDAWLLTALAPHNLEAAIDAMYDSQTRDARPTLTHGSLVDNNAK